MKMTPAEIAALDPYEGYPSWYNRVDMSFTGFMKGEDGNMAPVSLQGQAYIQTSQNTYNEPCLNYKIACCKTIYLSRKLIDPEADTLIDLEINNAMTRELAAEFTYSLSAEDIAGL